MTKPNYMRMVRAYKDPETLNGLRLDAQQDPELDSMDKDEILSAISNKFAAINAGASPMKLPSWHQSREQSRAREQAPNAQEETKAPSRVNIFTNHGAKLLVLFIFAASSLRVAALVPSANSGPPVTARRLAALSLVESGDQDNAIGRAGEVSRFQILPAVWRQYASGPRSMFDVRRSAFDVSHSIILDPRNAFTAWNVAAMIMHDRCNTFETRFHRAPTDAEFYLLWARPSWVTGHPFPRNRAYMLARAQRFANLVAR